MVVNSVQIQAILSYIIGILGLLGNIWLLAILAKKSASQFYILIKTLVSFDILFIGFSIAIQTNNFHSVWKSIKKVSIDI